MIADVRNGRVLAAMLLMAAAALPLAGTAAGQELVVNPGSLFFSYSPQGPLPGTQTVSVTTDTGAVAGFTAGASIGAWLLVDPGGGVTPGTLNIAADPRGLAPGAYSDSVTIVAGSSTKVIPVMLFIEKPGSELVATPRVLYFTVQAGGVPPPAKLAFVSNYRGTQSQFAVVTSGEGWLRASPNSAFTPGTLEVFVNQLGLAAGTYNGVINIFELDGDLAQTIHVTLVVTGGYPVTATPDSLSFNARSGVDAPQSRNLVVTSVSGQPMNFTTSASTLSGGDWLSVTPASGVANSIVAVTVNAAGLEVGTYAGSVAIAAQGQVLAIPVALTVTAGPALVVSAPSLAFQAGNGQVPSPQSLFVDSLSGDAVAFQVQTSGEQWLSVTPSSGATFAALAVTANPAALSAGAYSGLITITAQGSVIPEMVQVTLTITNEISLIAQPAFLSFSAQSGDTQPIPETLSITSDGPAQAFSVASSSAWLSVAPDTGATPGAVTVLADPAGLAEGRHHASVVISAAAGNSPVSIPVVLTIEPAGPAVAAVLHGASLTAGVVAPGTAVSIFGRSLGPEDGTGLRIGPDGKVATEVAGVRVLFDGIPGPLLYVQDRQINAMAPYGLTGRPFADLVVEYDGLRSTPRVIQITEASPGIFTADSTGQGQGAILNENTTPNSPANPAARGSIVSIYATGAGQMEPLGIDGEVISGVPPVPRLLVQVRIGGQEAAVEFAGAAPGLISGVLQVNARVPSALGPGIHPVSVRAGRFQSLFGVTIAIQ